MNAWCNSMSMTGCIAQVQKANGSLPLVALKDTDAQGETAQWRCYSPTCLDPSRTRYMSGSGCRLYCTHVAELEAELSLCSTFKLFKNGDNATTCFRIPNILDASGNGTLLAFVEARRNSCSDRGPKSLAMRKSHDGGATWGPTRFLVSDPDSAVDGLNLGASVRDLQTGQIFVHYGVCGHNCRPAGTTYVLSSSDLGESWNQINISDTVIGAGWSMINAGPGTGVQLTSGRLAVAVWGRRLGSSMATGGVATLYSDDHGSTWMLGQPILANQEFAPNENQLALLPNGSMLMNVRDAYANRGCHCRIMSLSIDSGITWSPFRREPQLTGPVCQGSMIARGPILVYSAPQSLEDRTDGYIKISMDQGRTWWLRGSRLDSEHDPGFGYSGLVALLGSPREGNASMRLGVIFEAGNGAGVTFKTIQIDYNMNM